MVRSAITGWLFSDLDVQRSTDYKFKEGMIAHRAEIYAGGNVVAYNGFIRKESYPGVIDCDRAAGCASLYYERMI